MATRLRADITRRPSIPLTARDEVDLAALRASPAYRQALADLTGTAATGDLTEAALLHAVLEAGFQSIRSVAEEAGYAAIASHQAAMEEQRATARRRKPTWADEA